MPLTIALTGTHVHDSKMFENLIDSIAPVRGKRGRPRRRPEKLSPKFDTDGAPAADLLAYYGHVT